METQESTVAIWSLFFTTNMNGRFRFHTIYFTEINSKKKKKTKMKWAWKHSCQYVGLDFNFQGITAVNQRN